MKDADKVQVTINFSSEVNWRNADGYNFAINDHVDVWRISVSANLPYLDRFMAIMPPDEIARANRYYHIRDKNRFIVSRGAIRNILANYLNASPPGLEFGEGKDKKPYLLNIFGDLHYNISHSGDQILVVVSRLENGCDIELIKPDLGFSEILTDNFAVAEINYIGNDHHRFFLLWTRKEALLKAIGIGLDGDLRLVPSLDGVHHPGRKVLPGADNWLVTSFMISENYTASICTSPLSNAARYWDIDLTKALK